MTTMTRRWAARRNHRVPAVRFGTDSDPGSEKPSRFFGFLPKYRRVRVPRHPLIPGSRPEGPITFLKIHVVVVSSTAGWRDMVRDIAVYG
jgi:hypothetical protein